MTDDQGTIALNVRRCMSVGLEVYDREGRKVGQVDNYEAAAGYMIVRTSPFADKDLFIPFSAVSHIDPRELFVSGTRDELLRTYADPPPRTVEMTENIDVDSSDRAGRTVITVPSGYDGTPFVVGGAYTSALAREIATGYEVYTADSQFVGRVNRYHREDDKLLVVGGLFHKISTAIPLALVEMVDPVLCSVSLAVSAADLRRFQRKPGEVVTVRSSHAR